MWQSFSISAKYCHFPPVSPPGRESSRRSQPSAHRSSRRRPGLRCWLRDTRGRYGRRSPLPVLAGSNRFQWRLPEKRSTLPCTRRRAPSSGGNSQRGDRPRHGSRRSRPARRRGRPTLRGDRSRAWPWRSRLRSHAAFRRRGAIPCPLPGEWRHRRRPRRAGKYWQR